MYDKHQIITPISHIQLQIEKFDTGEVSCFIYGATAKEELLFVNNLEEIVERIDSPRYMIAQSGWLQRKFGFSNYFAVPAVFAPVAILLPAVVNAFLPATTPPLMTSPRASSVLVSFIFCF